MNLENVKYDAFISYRHCELDKFVAENLHRQLEAFRIPKSLIKAGKTNGKTKIERVFRDRDELPLASNLADPITQALQSSDYLIVICSPRLPESKWCLKEIETFIAMHGREHVLAVLIEGEPIDSFPDILRFDERKVTDSDGTIRIEKTEVEPLAADVRGKDKNEVLKQIKNELMRLVAPMLDCNYDDLKMRHKEARQKRILRISLAISVVCLIFTAISTTMSLTIHRQSNTIEEQYQEALKAQSVSYASVSQTLLDEEDRMAAMSVARSVLPDSYHKQAQTPYTPQAEYALSDSLSVYNNGRSNFAVKTLEQTNPVNVMLISPNEDTITTVDVNNQITIYDVATTKVLVSYKIPNEFEKNLSEDSIAYFGNDTLIYIAGNGFYMYDITNNNATYIETAGSTSYVATSSDAAYFAISGFDGVELFDKEGNSIFFYEAPENYSGDSTMAFNPDRTLFAFSLSGIGKDIDTSYIGMYDVANRKLLYTAKVDTGYLTQASFYKDQLLLSGNSYAGYNRVLSGKENEDQMNVNEQTTGHLYSFPLNDETANWHYTTTYDTIEYFTGTQTWNSNYIILAGTNSTAYIDATTGTLVSSASLGAVPIEVAPLASDGYCYVLTEDGNKYIVAAEPEYGHLLIEQYDTSNGNFKDYAFTSNYDVGYRENATAVTLYQRTTSEQTEIIYTFEDSIYNATYSEKRNIMLVTLDNSLYLYNPKDGTAALVSDETDSAHQIFFIGENDEEFADYYDNTFTIYDTGTGEKKKSVTLNDILGEDDPVFVEIIQINNNGTEIAFGNSYGDTLYIYSFTDNEVTTIPLTDTLEFGDIVSFSSDLSRYAITSTTTNTLAVYDTKENTLRNECAINASLVQNIIFCDEENCILTTYLDCSVTAYNLTDLSVIRTYTDFATTVGNIEKIEVATKEHNKSTPVYALYGNYDCYLLNEDMIPVAHLYEYLAFDSDTQKFYLRNSGDILSVPYYSYDMLIEEADKLLNGYELSNYRKNQLGITD